MLRVLMYSGHFHPTVGGAERQAERLARALLSQGCKVAVLTPRLDAAWPEFEDLDGLPVHRFSLPDLTRLLPGLRGLGVPNTLMQRRATIRAVLRHAAGYDLLHAHLVSPGVIFAMDAAHRLRRPVVCKVACGGSEFDLDRLRRTSLLGPSLARAAVARMDRWVALSSEVRADLRRAGVPDERIASIPNGIEPHTLRVPQPRLPPRRFLWLGRLEKLDGATLVAAFDELLREVPDCELRIVGRGEAGPLRARLAAFQRARERTCFVEASDAAAELAWADAVVHPSLAEGMSNTLLEALTTGRPCIASDIVPNRETLGNGRAGLLVPLGAIRPMADALLRLARDNEIATCLSQAGPRQVALHYAMDVIARRYLELYRGMCARPSRGESRVP